MDFRAIIIFLGIYFLRPQDWVPFLIGVSLIKPLMLVALIATVTRKDGFRISEILKSPVDWMMGIYFGYVIFTAADPVGMFKEVLNLGAFYVVTAMALNGQYRLMTYLRWWMIFLICVASLGNLQMLGLDITRGAEFTTLFQGRLSLGTWMHDNPNALGHSVIVALPVIYFIMIWKRPVASKLTGLAFIAWCSWCIYETKSKGSYIAGFITFVCSQIFGRPKIVQIMVLALAVTFGMAGLSALPRMTTLSYKEAGIQGRLIVWSIAYNNMRQNPHGVGWGKFRAEFLWEKEWVRKAPHSSYVMIGATLGFPGLWLYLGIFYIVLKVVFTARSRDQEEERIRRIIFVLTCAFMLSNWMIDRAYHTEFFLTAAVASALHRLLYFRRSETAEDDAVEEIAAEDLALEFDPRLAGATAAVGTAGSMQTSWGLRVNRMHDETMQVIIPPGGRLDDLPPAEAKKYRGINWKFPGIMDIIGISLLWLIIVKLWEHVVKTYCMFPQG